MRTPPSHIHPTQLNSLSQSLLLLAHHAPAMRCLAQLTSPHASPASQPPCSQSLLAHHAPVMQSLAQLTSLHIMLPLDQRGLSLGTPETAFISCLTRLEDLALASPWREQGEHFLPASLPASLKSLQASGGTGGGT